jgi:hypothetical protein
MFLLNLHENNMYRFYWSTFKVQRKIVSFILILYLYLHYVLLANKTQ